ncbi:TIGR02594 family protein, partial [Enterococcus casseliflavus]|uniref:TIGR02594 family protein n=1 Tax=Enterococcus casseliflavus TaxID=37734 RepID=UPI003D0F67FC
SGFRNTGSLLARSYLKYGRRIEQPQEGCIAVFSRTKDPALGHVGFFIGETKNDIMILGGNQSNRVSVEPQSRERLLGYFLPTENEIAPLP